MTSQSQSPSASRLRLVYLEQGPRVAESSTIRSAHDVAHEIQLLIAHRDREHFIALHLDAKHQLIATEIVSIGTLTSSLVHPREVFKAAILSNASAIICAHNHPSGSLTPSREDDRVLERLTDAGTLLGITLLDFLIVSPDGYWASSSNAVTSL